MASRCCGRRTASIVTGLLFLLTVPFTPLVRLVPSEAAVPALVLVGFLMMQQVREIDWADLARRSRPKRRQRIADAYAEDIDDEPLELTRRPLADRAPKPEPAERREDRPAPVIAERGSSPGAAPAVAPAAPAPNSPKRIALRPVR